DGHQLGRHAQRGGDAGGKAHRAKGAGDLEQGVYQPQLGLKDHGQPGAGEDHADGDKGDDRSLAEGAGGDGIAESLLAPVGGGGLDALQQDEEGAGLDTAAGGSGGGADEHQNDQHQQAGAVELAQGVEIGRAHV